MFDIPSEYVENLLAPMMSAQIFMSVLIYITIVRKRITADYKLYVCFLVSFIIFLVGRVFQEFSDPLMGQKILYVRMTLLFLFGIPSLLTAAALQSGIAQTRSLFIWPYSIGFLISGAYVVFMDAAMSEMFFTRAMLSFCPFEMSIKVGKIILFFGALIMLVFPSLLLMLKELRGARSRTLMGFLLGALLFGLLMMIGVSGSHSVSLYYVGSIASACCWAWAVFKDIRDMKGKVALLKEELQYLVISGNQTQTPKIDQLLSSLEKLSEGNLDMYKIRIREILSMLTETTISAGGDTVVLIKRNKEQNQAIEESAYSSEVREIIRSEAVELSAMIAEIPVQQKNVIVDRAQAYIDERFFEEINVESVANHLNLSRGHLMREFKKITGKTVNQYVTGLRMERAKELLMDKTVTETAFEVGFNNSNYFSTVFKKYEGITPLNFKKQCDP